MRFEALPPPAQAEVERLLRVVRQRVLRLLEKRGAVPAQGPEDAQQTYQAHSLQQRLRWLELDVPLPPSKQPRCFFLEGFSLHANTHLHANDRQGLERLCRYGARGALALERLSRAEDGRIAWRMKRPLPDGTTHLVFTGLELLRRVASLVPPLRSNLTRFHGVFAPGAKLRPFLLPQAGAEPKREKAREPPDAATRQEPTQERTPRLTWAGLLRRNFVLDVFACGRWEGRLRVLAYLTTPDGVRAILEHLGLPTLPGMLARLGGPPEGLVLSHQQQWPVACHLFMGGRLEQACSLQGYGVGTPTWHLALRHSSAALLCLSALAPSLQHCPYPSYALLR